MNSRPHAANPANFPQLPAIAGNMTPTPSPNQPARSALRPTLIGVLIVWFAGALAFSLDLPSERSFVDEWAYLSQTYYADLWIGGQSDHPAWLEYPAYGLPPLPKYLCGLALRVGG